MYFEQGLLHWASFLAVLAAYGSKVLCQSCGALQQKKLSNHRALQTARRRHMQVRLHRYLMEIGLSSN